MALSSSSLDVARSGRTADDDNVPGPFVDGEHAEDKSFQGHFLDSPTLNRDERHGSGRGTFSTPRRVHPLFGPVNFVEFGRIWTSCVEFGRIT